MTEGLAGHEGSSVRAPRWVIYGLPVLCLPALVVLAFVVIGWLSAPQARAASLYTGPAFDTCAAPDAVAIDVAKALALARDGRPGQYRRAP